MTEYRNNYVIDNLAGESLNYEQINNVKYVSPGESIQAVIDNAPEKTKIVLEKGWHAPDNPVEISGNYWVLEFQPGARIAVDDGSEVGGDAGIGDYAIKVTGAARGDNTNWAIHRPQISNAEGCIYVETGGFFEILSPDLRFGHNGTGVGIGIDRANTFRIDGDGRINGQNGASSKGIQIGTIPDPGDNTTAVNQYRIGDAINCSHCDVGIQTGADSGRKNGSDATRWSFGGRIAADVERNTEGFVTTNGSLIDVKDAWFEGNDTAIHIDSNGSYAVNHITVETTRFAGNTNDIVQDGFMNGPLEVADQNHGLPSIDINGGSFDSYARLPAAPATFTGTADAVYLVNGVGSESANAEQPQKAHWPVGATVNFTDTGDGSGTGVHRLFESGWSQIA